MYHANLDLPRLTDLRCTTGNFAYFTKALIESRLISEAVR